MKGFLIPGEIKVESRRRTCKIKIVLSLFVTSAGFFVSYLCKRALRQYERFLSFEDIEDVVVLAEYEYISILNTVGVVLAFLGAVHLLFFLLEYKKLNKLVEYKKTHSNYWRFWHNFM